jgi:serine/threonine protein phosphatase 1
MAPVIHLEANPTGCDWVCGDIHGEFALLEQRLGEVGFEPSRDRLFCTGDLIDRGPASGRALEFVRYPWFISVRGNHDDFLLHHADPWIRQVWRFNGGQWWDTASHETRQAFVKAFRKLPLAITVETSRGPVGVVHGDVPAGETWPAFLASLEGGESEAVREALWGRTRWMRQDRSGVPGLHRLFCGHTVVGAESVTLGNVTFMDTGAAYYGTLTMIRLEMPEC